MRRHTCGGCEHLEHVADRLMGRLWGCGLRRNRNDSPALVPQHTKRRGDDPFDADSGWVTEFWRCPPECPLPDDQVVKSESKAHYKHREFVEFDA